MAEKTIKNAMVSDEFAKKFASEKETPYTRWVKNEGLDLISSTYVQNLHTVELKPWARRGGSGVFMNHEASRTSNDCYVCEIPPGKTLAPQRLQHPAPQPIGLSRNFTRLRPRQPQRGLTNQIHATPRTRLACCDPRASRR